MSDTALDVLNRQITEYQVDIENLKIKVADCAIKAHSTEPTEVSLIFDNLHKINRNNPRIFINPFVLKGIYLVIGN